MRTGVTGPGRLLATEIGRHRAALAVLAGWSLLEATPPLLSGQLVARALDRGFVAGRPATGAGYLLLLGLLYAVAALATRRCYPPVATIVESLRDGLLRRVVQAALGTAVATGGHADPAAVARINQHLETVRDVTAGLLLDLRRTAFTVVAAIVGLLTLDPAVALLVGVPVAACLAAFTILMITLNRRQRAAVLAEEAVAASAGPVVEGLRDVAALGAERHARQVVGADIDRQYRATTALVRAGGLRAPVIALGTYLPPVLILLVAPRLLRGGLSVGDLLGAITYLGAALEPALRSLVQTLGNAGIRLSVTLRRLVETITLPVPPAAVPGRAPRGHGIELSGLTFGYRPGTPVIRDLTLAVPAGDHLAIVGPSGIGKSTLACLLAGTERPWAGEIRIGGVPLADLGETALHATVTLIPQEAYVFDGTLWENLTYLRPAAPPHAVHAAADLFGLHPLRTRTGGYHTDLTPATLSAGERQLIALARAYLSTAPIAILDEATCHLDPAAEARAEAAFATRPGTLIVIAHRSTSARRARHILLMAEDDTCHGTHDSLLRTSPLYRDLTGLWTVHLPKFGVGRLPAG
jgi:ABC-type multidrug transport system fused ATPase/permease subunit